MNSYFYQSLCLFSLLFSLNACSPRSETQEQDIDATDAGENPDAGDTEGTDASDILPPLPCPQGYTAENERCIYYSEDTGEILSENYFDKINELFDTFSNNYILTEERNIDWNRIRDETFEFINRDPSITRYKADWIFTKAIGDINDGHVAVMSDSLCSTVNDQLRMFSTTNTGICVTESPEGVLVFGDYNNVLKPGDKILAINERPIEEVILDQVAQPKCLIRKTTEKQHRAEVVRSLFVRNSVDTSVTVQSPDGTENTYALEPQPEDYKYCYYGLRIPTIKLENKILHDVIDDIQYISFDYFYNDAGFVQTLDQLLINANTHKGIILDLRYNGGGYSNIVNRILELLADEEYTYMKYRVAYNFGEEPFESTETITPAIDAHISIPFVVLTEASGVSGVDFFVQALHFSGDGVSFGEEASGTFGNAASFEETGYSAFLSMFDARNLDNQLMLGRATPIYKKVDHSVESLTHQKDAILDAAINHILNQQ